MKKGKFIQAMLDDQEYEQFMKQYMEYFAAGKCINRSDYIRQMLGINGNQPPSKDSEPNKSNEIKDKEVNKEVVETPSKLAIDFDKLEI